MGKRKRGFTLIELLVVIAIIALLMSILMPALQRVKKQARTTACLANLKNWGLMFSLYCQDNDGYFFSGEVQGSRGRVTATIDGVTQNRDVGSGGFWRMTMYPYARETKMWVCPQATKPLPPPATIPRDTWAYTAWQTDDGDIGSYGLNGWILNLAAAKGDRARIWGRDDKDPLGRSRYWGAPSSQYGNELPVFTGMWWVDAWPLENDRPPPTENGPQDQVNVNEMIRVCVDRHDGFVNSVFADWSSRKIGLKELWTLKWHRAYITSGRYTKAGGMAPGDWPEWMRRYKDY